MLALLTLLVVVGIDPDSGLPGLPGAESFSRLAARARARAATAPRRPVAEFRADGSARMDVRTWMREFAVVRIGRDGRPVSGCGVSVPAADASTRDRGAQPASGEER
jgi:hypothetical protein